MTSEQQAVVRNREMLWFLTLCKGERSFSKRILCGLTTFISKPASQLGKIRFHCSYFAFFVIIVVVALGWCLRLGSLLLYNAIFICSVVFLYDFKSWPMMIQIINHYANNILLHRLQFLNSSKLDVWTKKSTQSQHNWLPKNLFKMLPWNYENQVFEKEKGIRKGKSNIVQLIRIVSDQATKL